MFMAAWCEKCAAADYEGDGCPIQLRAMALGVHDPDYPAEWNFTNGGVPQCSSFTLSPEVEHRCTDTLDMFEWASHQASYAL